MLLNTKKACKLLTMVAVTLLIASCSTNDKPKVAVSSESKHIPTAKVDLDKAAKIYVELAYSYMKSGNYSLAKSKLNRALKLSPDLSAVQYAYGYLYEKTEDFNKAEKHYLQALALNSNGGQENNNYGTFLCRHDRIAEAVERFLLAVADPNYTDVASSYENAAICLEKGGNLEKSKFYFQKALLNDSKRPQSLLRLAAIAMQEGDIESSQNYLKRYQLHAEPTAASTLLAIKIARHLGDDNAVASYELLLQNKFANSKENKHYRRQPQDVTVSEARNFPALPELPSSR